MSSRLAVTWLRGAAICLVVFGARLWLISRYGNSVPYWDQWDGEADLLLRPLVHGSFPSLRTLLSPHNEHRIFFTRLSTMLIFGINRQWDPLLEMMFSALLASVCASVLWRILSGVTGQRADALIACVVVVIFSLPFGWENALAGFQSGFFFLELFSFLAIRGLLTEGPSARKWWPGALCGLAACFSMASGFFAGVAVIAAVALGCARARRWPTRGQWFTLGAAMVIVLTGVATRTVVPGHASLVAQSPRAFLAALGSALAWPQVEAPVCLLVLWLPSLLLLASLLRGRTECPEGLTLAAYLSWIVLQALAMAYARGAGGSGPASRYMDALACGAPLNLAALVLLQPASWRARWLHTGVALAWAGALITGLGRLTAADVEIELPAKRDQAATQAKSVKDYLATHDLPALRSRRYLDSPYPNADRLASLLDDQRLSEVLPAELEPPIALESVANTCFARDGTWPTVPGDPQSPAWGSFGAEGNVSRCRFESQWFEPRGRQLLLELSGYLGAGQLKLTIEGQHSSVAVRPTHAAAERWETTTVLIPGGPVRVVAEDADSTRWFAFRNLRAIGPLSYFSKKLMARSEVICLAGILLLILASIWPQRVTSPLRAEAARP